MRRPASSAGMSADPRNDQAPVDDLGDEELDEVGGGVDQFGGVSTRGIAPNAMGAPVVPGANAQGLGGNGG